jgi:wobble nucleotide-excising tRNase
MIKKIVKIENVGTFKKYSAKSDVTWNGSFERINILYAPNGSGKTTLSTIFNSLSKSKPELVRLKQTIGSNSFPSISLIDSNKSGVISFIEKDWNGQIDNIEIFDIHFIEDFLFMSSVVHNKSSSNLLMLMLGKRGVNLKNKHKNLIKKRRDLEQRFENSKNKKSAKDKNLKTLEVNLTANKEAIDRSINDFLELATPVFSNYVELTNKYLSKFTNTIKVKSLLTPEIGFESERFKPSLNLEISGKLIKFKLPDLSKKVGNAKFTLSEGDKNAVALSFFLARLEILGVQDKIIVFDDPLSSFDRGRKTSTVYLLSKIATECEQFFLFTHDIYFAKAVSDKLDFKNPLNLKIERMQDSSTLIKHDINSETLSGFQKNLLTIKNYPNLPTKTEIDKRNVIRCIRPVLESIIKTKYFEHFSSNDWLGDIISSIRNVDESNVVSKLKPVLPDIIELNDFTKSYHHSEIENEPVNDIEIEHYLNLLKDTLLKI